jgi:predicted PurR-regulated permease PerM
VKTADLQLQRSFWFLGSLTLTGGLLYWARPILIPVTIAVLLTFVLTPIVERMERGGIPRFIASALAVIGLAVIVLGIVHLFTLQMRSLTSEIPAYKTQIAEKIGHLRQATAQSWIVGVVDFADELANKPIEDPAHDRQTQSVATRMEFPWIPVIQSIAGVAFEIIGNGVLVTVLALLMLMRREDLRNRLIHMLGADHLVSATRALDDASKRISRFLLCQLLVNVGFGIVVAIGLFLIGIPYAYVWGAMAAVLRYIPFLGGWIGAAFPLLASMVMPTWTPFFVTAAFFVVIELLQANLVEPQAYGHSIGVSAFGQLMALLFWACLWGPMGLILSTPLTACVCVLGRHYPGLRLIALLIGDDEILEKPAAFYQRLLAGDSVEAGELVEDFGKDHVAAEVIDAMLLPALRSAAADQRHGELSKDDELGIIDTVRDIFRDSVSPFGTNAEGKSTQETASERILVVDLPINDEIDALIVEMLRSTSAPDNFDWSAVAAKDIQTADEREPTLVLLATSRESHLARVRGLCMAARSRFPEAKILVGCWSLSDGIDRMSKRLKEAGATKVCTTINEARQFIGNARLEQCRESIPSATPAA